MAVYQASPADLSCLISLSVSLGHLLITNQKASLTLHMRSRIGADSGRRAFGAKINKGDPAGVTARDLRSEVVREWKGKKKKGEGCAVQRGCECSVGRKEVMGLVIRKEPEEEGGGKDCGSCEPGFLMGLLSISGMSGEIMSSPSVTHGFHGGKGYI